MPFQGFECKRNRVIEVRRTMSLSSTFATTSRKLPHVCNWLFIWQNINPISCSLSFAIIFRCSKFSDGVTNNNMNLILYARFLFFALSPLYMHHSLQLTVLSEQRFNCLIQSFFTLLFRNFRIIRFFIVSSTWSHVLKKKKSQQKNIRFIIHKSNPMA